MSSRKVPSDHMIVQAMLAHQNGPINQPGPGSISAQQQLLTGAMLPDRGRDMSSDLPALSLPDDSRAHIAGLVGEHRADGRSDKKTRRSNAAADRSLMAKRVLRDLDAESLALDLACPTTVGVTVCGRHVELELAICDEAWAA